jgi:hypothetical protein
MDKSEGNEGKGEVMLKKLLYLQKIKIKWIFNKIFKIVLENLSKSFSVFQYWTKFDSIWQNLTNVNKI